MTAACARGCRDGVNRKASDAGGVLVVPLGEVVFCDCAAGQEASRKSAARREGRSATIRFGTNDVRDLSGGLLPVEVWRIDVLADGTKREQRCGRTGKHDRVRPLTRNASKGWLDGAADAWVEVRPCDDAAPAPEPKPKLSRYDIEKGKPWTLLREGLKRPSSNWYDIRCPFCAHEVRAYLWSLAGGGKKCPGCSAKHTMNAAQTLPLRVAT